MKQKAYQYSSLLKQILNSQINSIRFFLFFVFVFYFQHPLKIQRSGLSRLLISTTLR